jgi:PleD family two-component response regulator
MMNTRMTARGPDVRPMAAPQKVVVVNGDAAILDLLEAALDVGHYNVVFVESNEHAYSQVKRVQPNLVILCMRIEEPEGFHVLSMLKLDPLTRDIPILTYTTEFEGQDLGAEFDEPSLPEARFLPALRMH